jgi:hypothetical protein
MKTRKHGKLRQLSTRLLGIEVKPSESTTALSAFNGNLHNKQSDNDYVQFVHASLGFPTSAPSMNVARKGFINGPNQYTRLTSKLVAKNRPNACHGYS